jgi:hypothetical protein
MFSLCLFSICAVLFQVVSELERFIAQGTFDRAKFDFRAVDTLRKLNEEDG